MMSERTLRWFTAGLCMATILIAPLFLMRIFTFSFFSVFPIHIGIMYAAVSLALRRRKPSYRWDGVLPKRVGQLLLALGLCGVLSLVFGIARMDALVAWGGTTIHQVNGYFEHGKCLGVFNRSLPREMPLAFCEDFLVASVAFMSGIWLIFATVLHGFSWKLRRVG
mgnify:CR=1 FL=1